MLTLMPDVSAIWLPDGVTPVMQPPAQDVNMAQHPAQSVEEEHPPQNLSRTTTEGSGGRSGGAEGEEEYTDEYEWEKEGQEQSFSKLGFRSYEEEPASDVDEVQDVFEGRVEVREPLEPSSNEDVDKMDKDMYFEEVEGDVTAGHGRPTSSTPDPQLPDPIQTESIETELNAKPNHQLNGEPVDAFAPHGESATVSSHTTIVSAGDGKDSSMKPAPSMHQSSTTMPSYESQHQTNPSTFHSPHVHFAAVVADDETDDAAAVDVNPDEGDDDGNIVIEPHAAPLPPPKSSTASPAATTTKTPTRLASAATAVESATVSAAVAFIESSSGTSLSADPDSDNDSTSESATVSESKSTDQVSPTSLISPSSPSPSPACPTRMRNHPRLPCSSSRTSGSSTSASGHQHHPVLQPDQTHRKRRSNEARVGVSPGQRK